MSSSIVTLIYITIVQLSLVYSYFLYYSNSVACRETGRIRSVQYVFFSPTTPEAIVGAPDLCQNYGSTIVQKKNMASST